MFGASPELGPIRSSRNETGKILCSYTTRPSPSDTIFRLRLRGKETIVVSSFKLVEESCDETRFRKAVSDSLDDGKSSVAHGLFTSPCEKDPDWGQTHRVLAPAFGPLPINDMFGGQ